MAFYIKKKINNVDQDPNRLGVIPNGYPARKIALADGRSVQDLANSGFGTRVNIASYTSSANKYTCPSDGYIRFEGTNGVSLELNDVTMFQNTNMRTSIYVRKGMTVWFSTGTLSLAEFIPLV